MVNKTPAELDVGTPSDTSVVHASQDNDTENSKGHNQRDISRLQGTSYGYDDTKTYKIGDLATTDEPNHNQPIVHCCTVDIPVAEPFDTSKWEVVAIPSSFEEATNPMENSTVLIANDNNKDLPRRTDIRTVSRLQGTAPDYSDTKTYAINDLITESDIVYRCTTAVTVAETFDPGKWNEIGNDSPLTTKGDLYGFDTDDNRVPVGTDGQLLTSDSTETLGVKWEDAAAHIANAPPYSASETYEIGDLVNEGTQVYRCIVLVAAPESFDPSKWRVVGNAAPNYLSSETYELNEIVTENSLVYRCSTAIVTPEIFDSDKWNLVWDTPDVVRIFSEDDFPAPVSGEIRLEDNTDYRISAPINLTNTLIAPIGGKITISSESKQQCVVTTSGGMIDILNTLTEAPPNILSFADSGGDLLITTGLFHNFPVGSLVNIAADTISSYTQLKATVLSAPTGQSFTISGTFVGTDTGWADQNPVEVILKDVTISNPGGNRTGFEIRTTQVGETYVTIDNIETDGLSFIGAVQNVHNAFINNCKFLNSEEGLSLRSDEVVHVSDCHFHTTSFFDAITITDDVNTDIQQISISNCSFETPNSENAVFISGTNLEADASITVSDCIDQNKTHDTLFNSGGLDETDPRVHAHDNVRQKNSIATIQVEYPFSAGLMGVTPTTANVIEPLTDTAWTVDFSERFSLDTGPVTGEFTYDGLENARFQVNYNVSIGSSTASQEIFAGMTKNGTEITGARFTIGDADVGEEFYASHSFIVDLVTGDVLQMGAGNVNTTDQLGVEQVSVTVSKLS